MAIGYNAEPATMPAALKERDMAPRQRRHLQRFCVCRPLEGGSTAGHQT